MPLADLDPLIGHKLDGRYTLEQLIGEGGTGRVYRARQEATGRLVAVKLLRDSLLHDTASLRRFQREARAASRINHPNAIIVHDFGQTADGHVYLVTELVEGETLQAALEREGVLPPERALWLFREILAGVAAAHEVGVVHRDLRPGNIFLCHDSHGQEHIKVFDFGGARLLDNQQDSNITGVGRLDLRQLLGSIRYLPPERLQRDRPPDTRGDVYALGLVLFELCTGRYPFESDDPLQVMAMHMREMPPLLSACSGERRFSPALQGLVTSMLAKDPELRPRDAREVAERLAHAEEREVLISTAEVVPEPELEMEMVAEPADEAPPAALPVDTVIDMAPAGAAPVVAVAPVRTATVQVQPPRPLPSSRSTPAPRDDRRVMGALLWVLLVAAVVFAGGTLAFRLYQHAHAKRAPALPPTALQFEPSSGGAPQGLRPTRPSEPGEPPPAPLR